MYTVSNNIDNGDVVIRDAHGSIICTFEETNFLDMVTTVEQAKKKINEYATLMCNFLNSSEL